MTYTATIITSANHSKCLTNKINRPKITSKQAVHYYEHRHTYFPKRRAITAENSRNNQLVNAHESSLPSNNWKIKKHLIPYYLKKR